MDNGRHFKNSNVIQLLESRGVQQIWSIPYMPETNGVAERAVQAAKDWIIKNAARNWDTPEKLVLMHEHIQAPKLKEKEVEPRPNPSTLVLQIKIDKVWVNKRMVNPNKEAIKAKTEA